MTNQSLTDMNRIFVVFLLCCCFGTFNYAQNKKILNIKRTEIAPKIDGILDDDAWVNADEAKDFIQFTPAVGTVEKDYKKTVV